MIQARVSQKRRPSNRFDDDYDPIGDESKTDLLSHVFNDISINRDSGRNMLEFTNMS